MNYKRYHTALVMARVLCGLLKDTELESKALSLYADIIERERVAEYHVKTANKQVQAILTAFEQGETKPPSPFTLWQRIGRWLSG